MDEWFTLKYGGKYVIINTKFLIRANINEALETEIL